MKRKTEHVKPRNRNRAKKHKMCSCGKAQPSLGLKGQKKPIWCARCPDKPPDAIDIKTRRCVCGKRKPTFNRKGEITAIWCADCPEKPTEAIDVINRRCVCGKAQPTFNRDGETKAIWCANCPEKPTDAIDVINRRCVCGKGRPAFNLKGETIAIWCPKCPDKPKDVIDIVHRQCVCGKGQPTFNRKGETIAIWCVECPDKPMDAIDVINRRCVCGKGQPSFNLTGETIAIWCAHCPDKSPNAIDVIHRRCVCGKSIPTFNIKGETTGIWCARCPDKPSDAIDVYHPQCHCGNRAYYNIVGQKPAFCLKHKTPQMVSSPTKRCEFPKCRELAIYGVHDREHCETHREEAEFNLVERPCLLCGLPNVLSDRQLCSTCEPERAQQYIKRKETRIKHFLDANHIVYESNDKMIDHGACGKERPDFPIDCKTHKVILEVDENQHKYEMEECRTTRMKNVSQMCGGMPVFWIRYNPDAFKLPNGVTAKMTTHQREEHLLEWIHWAMSHPPTAFASVIYLFYDGCETKMGGNAIQVLTPFDS